MSVRHQQRKKHVKRHKHSKNPGWMMEAQIAWIAGLVSALILV